MAAAARDELQKEWQSTKPLLKALTNSLDFLCDATNIELLSDAQSIDVVTTTLIQLRLKATTALSNLADTTEGLVAAVTKFHIVEKVLDDTNKDIANAIVDKLAAGITFTEDELTEGIPELTTLTPTENPNGDKDWRTMFCDKSGTKFNHNRTYALFKYAAEEETFRLSGPKEMSEHVAGHYWNRHRSGLPHQLIAKELAKDMGLEARLGDAVKQLELPGIREVTDEQLQALSDELDCPELATEPAMLAVAQAMVPSEAAQTELAQVCSQMWRGNATRDLQSRMQELHSDHEDTGVDHWRMLADLHQACVGLFRQPAAAAEEMEECIGQWVLDSLILPNKGALLARLTASGAIEENPAMAEAMLAKRPAVGSLKKLRRRLEQVNTDVYTAWEDGANNLDVEDDTSVASDAPPVV